MFSQSTIQEVLRRDVPAVMEFCRAWDKAASEPSKDSSAGKAANPDYTASIKMGKDEDNNIYIFGDFVRDKQGNQRARFRERVGKRDEYILEQAFEDGQNTVIYFPKDPAQSGTFEFIESAKKLQVEGFTVLQDVCPSNRSKAKRFEAFCGGCASHNVYWVRDSFDHNVWDYMIQELINFDGDKNGGYKDDIVDAISTAYNSLIVKQIIPTPPVMNSKRLPDRRSKVAVVRRNIR